MISRSELEVRGYWTRLVRCCSASPMIRDCLAWVHQLGILFNQSGKFKRMFENIATSENEPITTLKPLCPTRWTVRNSAIIAVLGQYERVLVSLEEMAKTASGQLQLPVAYLSTSVKTEELPKKDKPPQMEESQKRDGPLQTDESPKTEEGLQVDKPLQTDVSPKTDTSQQTEESPKTDEPPQRDDSQKTEESSQSEESAKTDELRQSDTDKSPLIPGKTDHWSRH
ncbi:hypothetical protein QQF64_025693 [Cirrhinus molitorella]|uniref:Uncharacterized protein n=1 Tax=Cirrhinus molitorella TaxID=172907 RepID=A0ABR3NQ72_9TELE